ncbi:hypothetical protein CWS31_008685 [Colwellia echini]|uniref:Porin n=1 Tax=Colwellia echini TaxID=1982103 RepID=A0ABY3MX96_9GAMM|nr:hypothetical protein CWS31_008685 [Colwellia echini]
MVKKSKFNVKKIVLATSLLAITSAANASYTLELDDGDSLTFGGYIKIDARYMDGNIAANDYFYGGGTVLDSDINNFGIAANETRFNTKYTHGDVTGFIEVDFYGDGVSGGGNQIISNSSNLRLRQAYIQYKDILVGQAWTTFQNTSAIVEAADFAGPLVATAFIRQGQIRYTNGGLQLSIENPETYGTGGVTGDDSVPDFIGKYTFSGDWGNVSVSGLVRQLQTTTGTETGVGFGVAGRVKTFGKDDIRFQINAGNVGRYVGVTAITDVVNGEVEDSTSIMVAYRHFWNETLRSTIFYGGTTTDLSDRDRSQVGVNLFQNITKQLSVGVEVGNFDMANTASASGNTVGGSSNYIQFSTKFVL